MIKHHAVYERFRHVFRNRSKLEVFHLENRLALSLYRTVLRAAAASSADFAVIRGSIVAGTLDIQGTAGADSVEIGRSAPGFVTLTIDGVVRSGDLRDRVAFDRRLAGLKVDRLRFVRLMGDQAIDTLVLNTAIGSTDRPSRIQGNAVTLAAPVSHTGTLRIDARAITVSAPVQADAIILSASGLLNLEAAGTLTGAKSIELTADRLMQTGNLAAPAVTIHASVAMRSGTITAPGGSVAFTFSENYVATQGAVIDVSASTSAGGSIRIDGGAAGHFFSSGSLLAMGRTTGGEIRASGKEVVWVGGGADASGHQAGGLVQIGGGWQGSDASRSKAATLKVSLYKNFKADGGELGNILQSLAIHNPSPPERTVAIRWVSDSRFSLFES